MDTVTRVTTSERRPSEARSAEPVRAGDRANCVLCSEPTEYPASTKGATLCPVCEWQQGEPEANCAC